MVVVLCLYVERDLLLLWFHDGGDGGERRKGSSSGKDTATNKDNDKEKSLS